MTQHVILRDAAPIASLALSRDAGTLVVAHRDGQVVVYSAGDPLHETARFATGLTHVHRVALDASATRLAVAGRGPLMVHAVPDGTLLATLECGAARDVHCVAWQPGGECVLAAGDDESLRLIRVDDGSLVDACPAGERTTSIVFHPDGHTFAMTSSWERESALCFGSATDTLSLFPAPRVRRPSTRLYPAAFSADGHHLAFSDGEVQVYSWPEGRRLHTFDASGERVDDAVADEPVTTAGKWSPAIFGNEGRSVACGNSCGVLYVWDVASGDLEKALEVHAGPVSALVASPLTGGVFTAGGDRTVRYWEDVFKGTRGTRPA